MPLLKNSAHTQKEQTTDNVTNVMISNPKAHWNRALELIKNELSEQQFNNIFSKITFESYNPSTLTLLVRVPSAYVQEYIEEHHVDLLSRVLVQTFGPGIHLNYRIVTDKMHHITQEVRSDIDVTGPAVSQNPHISSAPPVQNIDSQLNPQMSFNNFIEGDSNKLARSVALNIAEHPNSTQFNPLFIFGHSGCGKTHLINAVGLKTKKTYPQKQVLYVTARTFQMQFQTARLENKINDFIHFYQGIDVLIVDDVQEWVTAEKTQTTFFHIFNHLFANGKRIILACDKPPVELRGMSERLLTRFSCGLIAELEQPNVKLREDILRSKIARDGLDVDEDVIRYVAENANGSVRDLEGILNSLLAYSVVYNAPINMEFTEKVMQHTVHSSPKTFDLDHLVDITAEQYNIASAAILGRGRKKEIAEARQVVMYIAHTKGNLSFSYIGKMLGRDHSTVKHNIEAITKRLEKDKAFKTKVKEIQKAV